MAIKKRIPKQITDKNDIDFLLSITEKDFTMSFIAENFGIIGGKVRFNTYDEFTVPAGSYGKEGKKNKNAFKTTVGKWYFNKMFIEGELFDIFQWVDEPITKGQIGKMNSIISEAVVEERLSLDALKNFQMKTQKIMPCVSILSPNHSMDMLTISKTIEPKKKELLKKYEKEIAAGDEIIADKITAELLDYAANILKDDPAMDSFRSGAGGSFDNNFKNMYIMKGAIKDPDPLKGYNIVTSSYTEGISKEDYPLMANSLAAGPYKRGKKTQIGGYWEKLFITAFQHVRLGKPGSDCGTENTIEVDVTSKNIDSIMYCYVKEGNKLTEITSENKEKFIGKTVKLRFASLCEYTKEPGCICNKCAGNLFYMIGVHNIGTATPQIPSTLKNISMKAFHDSTVRLVEMDPMKAFCSK